MSGYHISICICTFRRPRLLERLIAKLAEQITDNQFTYSVVIVDNDPEQSGRAAVARMSADLPLSIEYAVEPERSISLARNRSVAMAKGNLIAFIDDDEFPAREWLLNHLRALLSTKADGVLGPVLPHFEDGGPAWLLRSGLLDRRRFRTGEAIPSYRDTRTGNVLLWKRLFETGIVFDPKYGRSGGGDAVFFQRQMQNGKTFVWCDEAVVYETVPAERQSKSYYVKRAFTRGMTEAWVTKPLSVGTVRSLVAVILYGCALPVLFFVGEHLFIKYLVKTCDHVSKLLAHIGIHVVSERPYAAPCGIVAQGPCRAEGKSC